MEYDVKNILKIGIQKYTQNWNNINNVKNGIKATSLIDQTTLITFFTNIPSYPAALSKYFTKKHNQKQI